MHELSEKAKRLIDGKNFASVATITSNGWPHVTPTWVDRDGNTVILNITPKRAKYKYFANSPRVAISVFDHANPYDKVVIRGKIISTTKQGAEEHIDKMSKKYLGKDIYPNHRADEPRVLVRVEPVKVME